VARPLRHLRDKAKGVQDKKSIRAQGIDQVTRPTKDSFRDALVAAIPHLRAFAVSLCHDVHRADDLAQETLVKGWQNREIFEAGTNLKAWLFTILRNTYFSERRRTKHVLVEANSDIVERLSQQPTQPGHLDLQDFLAALYRLKPGQREALVLVGAEGFSYEEAAQICGCPVGTIRSRVNRARRHLVELLKVSAREEYRADAVSHSITARTSIAYHRPLDLSIGE
jgi:RNA polymerase sigma-70 factor, ECF subfamily